MIITLEIPQVAADAIALWAARTGIKPRKIAEVWLTQRAIRKLAQLQRDPNPTPDRHRR